MTQSARLPISLIVVATASIFVGVYSTIDVLLSLADSNIKLNFGVLGLFIGTGVLRLRQGWRTCGLVFTWFGILTTPIFAFFLVSQSGPHTLSVPGANSGHATKELGLLMIVALFTFFVWQYRVLTRPDVRSFFRLPPH